MAKYTIKINNAYGEREITKEFPNQTKMSDYISLMIRNDSCVKVISVTKHINSSVYLKSLHQYYGRS